MVIGESITVMRYFIFDCFVGPYHPAPTFIADNIYIFAPISGGRGCKGRIVFHVLELERTLHPSE